LENSSVLVNGLKIYGLPITPYFLGMAFNKRRGDEIKKVWKKIPSDTDIPITHGPPFGILDKNVGCEELLAKVIKVKPKLHVFGHIPSRVWRVCRK
jgi:Icc-related predicted phosphoesterase